ncbi:MAG: class I SAM-dependent methyltransferase [Anaerolineae bacterium]|jgi:SAM-dependent methyltransferase|nr:class I SAM-dependent methyltransferase [Anaerolineae bacterium]
MSRSGGYDAQPFVAELYDHIVPYRDRPDTAFWIDAAQASGGPVLEIGCGTGRILIPTARAGVDIVGLDLSSHMLDICRQKLSSEPEEVRSRVELLHADMRSFELARTFGLVTTPFRPFQHLTTVEDQLACLACIHRHLAPGGKLILDLFNPSLPTMTSDTVGQELGEEPEFTLPDGRRVVRRNRTVSRDYFNQINYVELIYYVTHPDGRAERLVHSFPMRYLFRFEAEHLLVRSGFEVEAVYADFERHPYGSTYPGELILVATKMWG